MATDSTCSACGARLARATPFCTSCGAPQARRCAGCGGELAAGDGFCGACGRPAGRGAPPAPARGAGLRARLARAGALGRALPAIALLAGFAGVFGVDLVTCHTCDGIGTFFVKCRDCGGDGMQTIWQYVRSSLR